MAIPALAELLRDKGRVVRAGAAGALWHILGPEAKEAIPILNALTELLKNEREGVRQITVEVLGKIGPEAKPAVPDITELLNRENEDVRRAAADALKKMKRTGS
jgi:HEAT repeat protein